jgi:hypothetical protein
MPVLSIATYILTLNLDSIVLLWRRLTEGNGKPRRHELAIGALRSRFLEGNQNEGKPPGPPLAHLGDIHVQVEVDVKDVTPGG